MTEQHQSAQEKETPFSKFDLLKQEAGKLNPALTDEQRGQYAQQQIEMAEAAVRSRRALGR